MAAAPEQLELETARSQTEAFYRQHGAAVLRICGAVLHDRGEAEDAMQQVFLSAHRALLGGAVPREPLAWLATIARRECWSRSSPRIAMREPDAGLAASDASAEAIRNAEVAALWTAIAELPGAQREALLLREIRGLSYLQLGEELSLSPPATRSLLARARLSVRVRLRDLHTALGSASWIEALARLFAGGANPAAPAARAAALGLGAAAIAGGAVVTPSALEHHVRRPVAAAKPAPRAHAAGRVRHPAVRVTPVHATVVRPRAEAPASPHSDRGRGRTAHIEHRGPARSSPEGHDNRGTPVTSRDGGSSGEEVVAVTSTTGHEGPSDSGDSHGSRSTGDGGTTSVETATTATTAATTATTVAFQTSGHDGEGGGDLSGGSGDGGGGSNSGRDGGVGGTDGGH